jgi:hypothetical protein
MSFVQVEIIFSGGKFVENLPVNETLSEVNRERCAKNRQI